MFQRIPDPDTLPAREEHWRDFIKHLRDYLRVIVNQINTQVQDVGPDLQAAPVMKPSHAIHRVMGVGVIDTIVAPIGFSGFIRFVAGDAWTVSTAGNVALGVTPAVGEVVLFDYVPELRKWFPISRGGGSGNGDPVGTPGPAGPPGPPGRDSADDFGDGDTGSLGAMGMLTDPANANIIQLPTDTYSAKCGTFNTTGNNTIHTPTVGMRTRIHYMSMNASPGNSNAVVATVKFTAAGAGIWNYELLPGAIWARNVGAGRRYIEGGVNEALIVNMSSNQRIYWSIEYEEVP